MRRGPLRTSCRRKAAHRSDPSIKSRLGRLDLDDIDLVAELGRNDFVELPVTAAHGWSAGQVPLHHPDPFDRLLVERARSDQWLLVTDDEQLFADDVTILGR